VFVSLTRRLPPVRTRVAEGALLKLVMPLAGRFVAHRYKAGR
jgi:hypothetical protein